VRRPVVADFRLTRHHEVGVNPQPIIGLAWGMALCDGAHTRIGAACRTASSAASDPSTGTVIFMGQQPLRNSHSLASPRSRTSGNAQTTSTGPCSISDRERPVRTG
jgi:hypothetical protein